MATTADPPSFPTHLKTSVVTDMVTQRTEEQDGDYLFNVDLSSDRRIIAVSTSRNTTKLYDSQTLGLVGQLAGHTDTISEVHFVQFSPTVVATASRDRTLILWDYRSGKEVQRYNHEESFFTFATGGPTGTMLAAGCGCEVCVWDARNGQCLHKLSDIHTDEVTQVRFHPHLSNILLTGSMDGLSTTVDVTQADPDEVLQTTMNKNESISKILSCGANGQYLAVLTHSERMYVWDIFQGSTVVDFGPTFREQLASWHGVNINYFIDCKYLGDQLLLFAGSFEGDINVYSVAPDNVKPVASLGKGHTALVRDVWIEKDCSQLISVGEDSKICVWSHPSVSGHEKKEQRKAPVDKISTQMRWKPY